MNQNGMKNIGLFALLLGTLIVAGVLLAKDQTSDRQKLQLVSHHLQDPLWFGPDTIFIPNDSRGKQIRYGRELISNTAKYLGPKGSVTQISSGLNCQNCHLNAGAQPWGNNFFAVHSTYPQFRSRSGSLETETKRVNDCFERSMAGQTLDTAGKEMKAILSYIEWLGSDVKKGIKPKGVGVNELKILDRAADPVNGKSIFEAHCASCHGVDGQGKLNEDGVGYKFPPLWGSHSYNEAAGLFRLSRFAGYARDNMPIGATHDKPVLTDEEAWDVAAFVNSQSRPKHPFLKQDWPDISGKPFDHPFGPFADPFPESQHKYGPFGPIKKFKQEAKAKKEAAAKTATGQPLVK
jgi:thiosulfate dehydrogenase